MPIRRIHDHDLFWLESGSGPAPPLLMIHGSLCDARYWAPQMGPLGAGRRAIAVSLRHCWPAAWDGRGAGYHVDQHVADLAAFIDTLDVPQVDVMGHSRGGYVAYRLALRLPARVRKLILAEPGGQPDASLGEIAGFDAQRTPALMVEAARRIEAGHIDEGLAHFIDGISGLPIWAQTVPAFKRMARDNAHTLLAQVRETRAAYTRRDLESLAGVPILLVGGALTPSPFPELLALLAAQLPGARRVTIPGARHAMNLAAPGPFNIALSGFLEGDEAPQ